MAKRVRESLDADAPKRARRPPTDEESKSEDQVPPPASDDSPPFPRLDGIKFPGAIQALPHVLKLLNTLLLSPNKALLEAVQTHHQKWVEQLLDRFDCDLSVSLIEAASKGCKDIVNLLLDKLLIVGKNKETKLIVKNAVEAAAANGHLEIVELQLPMMLELYFENRYSSSSFQALRSIMDAAARNGQVEVVEFMIQHAIDGRYSASYAIWPSVDTLALAMAGKHTEVVKILLDADDFLWNLRDAFNEAVKTGQTQIADKICEIFPYRFRGENLFAEMASRGFLDAVVYLYNHGHDDQRHVGKAFASAASAGKMDVVKFVLATGLVSRDDFDKAFKSACSGWQNFSTVKFLYGLKRASPQGINRAFGAANSFEIIEFLTKNENISEEAVCAAFKRLACCGSVFDEDIVKFLYTQKYISSQLIDGFRASSKS